MESQQPSPGLALEVRRSMRLPMLEALTFVNKKGLVIASNKRLDNSLLTEEWMNVKEGFPCRSGTIVGYEAPDKPLSVSIQFTDPQTGEVYGFPVPEEYWGRKNIALVAEHPNFSFNKVGRIMTVFAKEVGVVEDFPSESGWYAPDLKYGIPHGVKKTEEFQAARRLWRNDGPMVGLAVREAGDNDRSRHVGLRNRPSYKDLGVIVDLDKSGPVKSETKTTEDGVLLTGLTVAQFTGLFAEAQDNYEQLRAKLPLSALQGIRRLLDSLVLK